MKKYYASTGTPYTDTTSSSSTTTTTTMSVSKPFIKYNNPNSCYLDTLIVILKQLVDVSSFLKKGISKHSVDVRNAIIRNDNVKLRKLFYKIDKNDEWLNAQREPLDVVNMLNTLFSIPKTVIVRETKMGKTPTQKKTECYKYLNEDITKSGFDFKFVNTDKDIKIKINEKENLLYSGNTLFRNTYSDVIISKTILSTSFLMMHINRRNVHNKLTFLVTPPKKVLCTQLRAVIVHLGNSISSGHYIGYFKKGTKWFKYDDMENDFEEVGKKLSPSVFRNCTDLFYI